MMERRHAELSELKSYLAKIDKEVTMVLQSLQWDRKHLMEGEDAETCSINSHHKVTHLTKEVHERECVHTSNGYNRDVQMLPEPADVNAATLVTFSTDKIRDIIENASGSDPRFRKGCGHNATMEPLTLDRLQSSYTPDERRAIHDAVVAAAPEHEDLTELPLASVEERKAERAKSKQQVLSELRDLRRRRAKYRVANNTRNYSDVLRGLISSQMEMLTEVKKEPTEIIQNDHVHTRKSNLIVKDRDHNLNEKRIETSRYKDTQYNRVERESATRARYETDDSTRRDHRDRRHEKDYRSKINSCTTPKDTSRDKHYVKDYSERKTDKRRERDKDYRSNRSSSSKHEYYKREKDETHEKYNIKYERDRDYYHNDYDNEQDKYKTVQVKIERDSVSPGSSKDWKSYKEHVKRREETTGYEDYQYKSHASKEDYKRKGDKFKRYYEHDTGVDKKRHKKHSGDKCRD